MRNNLKINLAILLLSAFCACNSNDAASEEANSGAPPPPTLVFNVVNTYPHDTASFTQGLAVYKGKLYESTGQYGTSWLGPVNPETGIIDRKVTLPKEQFGEGITVMNDKIYQLTWQHHKGYIYDVNTFSKLGEFNYVTDGWGLTNDSTNLIMSDGSSNLYFFNPDSVKLIKTLTVSDNVGPVPNLNELEFIDGFIYANQWQTPYILKIDPVKGEVVGRLDFKKIQTEIEAKMPGTDFAENALNGIAYDAENNKLYITGKRWPTMYEIKLQ